MWREVIVAVGLVALVGCGEPGKTATGSTEGKKKVGFAQQISNSSLDELREGYIRGLKDGGFEEGKNLVLLQKNAQGDIASLQLIMKGFVDEKVDLVGTVSSAAFQAALQNVKEIPVVFTGVIDPVVAGGGPSLDQMPANVTGVYNPFDVEPVVALVKDLMPSVTTVGSLVDPGEPFTAQLQKQAKEACAKHGLRWVEVPVSDVTDAIPGVQALQSRGVQAMVHLPSNKLNSTMDALVAEAKKLRIPAFSMQYDQVKQGLVGAIGWDFSEEGHEAGLLAARVLKGEKPKELPLQIPTKVRFVLGEKTASEFGIAIPEAIRARANEIQK
ncbi:MAG: ABC transporter substrate-binding protein [Fimbriimonadaceae bacterium]|nr:ABC transporter substrate-binding protein [Fimbriimonadaceae bacterium]